MPQFIFFLKVHFLIARILPLPNPPIDCFIPESFGMIYFLEVPNWAKPIRWAKTGWIGLRSQVTLSI